MVEILGIRERKMTMKNSYTTKGLHTVSQAVNPSPIPIPSKTDGSTGFLDA